MTEWTFSEHAQLVEAGYVWRGYGVCGQCRARILWYTNVDRNKVPVDPGTYVIHFASCAARKKPAADPAKVIDFAQARQRQIWPGSGKTPKTS